MREWQREFIRDVYEPHSIAGRRLVRRAILSIARKNGKTALIAVLVLAHLVGPEAIANGEIYSAANDREQAAQVFKVARQIVDADPELGSLLKVVPSTKTITCPSNGSFYRAISAEAGTKHGLNPTLVIYDELAQSKTRDLYDVLDTSMGARQEPLFIVISTQSPDPQHTLSLLIDDGLNSDDPTIATHLYEVDEDADIFDETVWRDANPALGDFRSTDDVKALAERARRIPSFENEFRNLYLNQRVHAQAPLVSRRTWESCEGRFEFEPGEEIYLGLDLSQTTDLAALSGMSAGADVDRLKGWFWKPADTIHDHARRDRSPYDTWVKQGFIEAPPGVAVDYGFVAKRIADLCQMYTVRGLAYDRWRIDVLRKEFERIGFETYIDGKSEAATGLRMVPFGQGFHDMAPAVDAFEISAAGGKLLHDGNPVMTMCFANAIPVRDPAGNRKLDKAKARLRIDGAVAAVMAKGLKAKDMAVEASVSIPDNYFMSV